MAVADFAMRFPYGIPYYVARLAEMRPALIHDVVAFAILTALVAIGMT